MREIIRSMLVLFLFLLLCGSPMGQSWAAAAKSGFDEKAVADFYKGKTVRIIVGFSAGGGYDAYSRLRDALGANLKVVSGYKGTSDIRLAIDSGEVDGLFNSWTSMKITSFDKIKSGEWLVLAQMGEEPIGDLPNSKNIPTIPMVAKTPEQRQLLRFGIAAPNQFGKIYVLPPGTPAERVAALEAAFTKTFADKEFLAEADKGRLEIDPVSAQQAHELITEFMGMSPTVRGQLQKMLRASK